MVKNFIVAFLLVFVSQAYGQCSLNDIHVTQSRTGRTVGGKPEWSVTITNWCACVQQNVQLNCKGFKTVEPVESSLLKVSGDVCLLSLGQPVWKGAIEFNYAWDTQFPLNPISSKVAC
ncbi:hypothetical protein PHAVU_010G051700 [Phaseolus vulgaris]|uniref:Uncharacterized protein n=1 Tax=Phaseolus vulgaris TaxID=3885 RepID=V7AMI5_PHAVU|nr:hypothetical protein PHAVU_010G051700g [Phaseolus vulgaris]ESW06485.1 hypothetical protein PHAVU_010G051700g [Phaseolus vulgaris]